MKAIFFLMALFAVLGVRGQMGEKRTIPAVFLVTDTLGDGLCRAVAGYLVQELHNTSEGINDAGAQTCIDSNGNTVSCWSDFWVTVKKLARNKKPFPVGYVIWQIKENP